MSRKKRIQYVESEDVEKVRKALIKSNANKSSSVKQFKRVEAKTKGQQNYIDCIRNNDITLCDGLYGTGKAQPLYSLVFTENGKKTIGEIQIGEKVACPDGTFSEVIGIFDQGLKPVYEFVFRDGTKVRSSDEHLWLVEFIDKGLKPLIKTTKEIIEICNKDEEKSQIGIRPLSIPVDFKAQELLIDPYLMGLILGDGCLAGINVGFSSADQEIIDSINIILSNTSCHIKKRDGLYDYSIIGNRNKNEKRQANEILLAIRKYGLGSKKSNNKFIPQEYLYNTAKNRLEILRGLLDTDGSICDTFTIEYSTVSKQLSEQVAFLVESLGGICRTVERTTFYTYKGEKKQGQLSYRLYIKMPNDVIPFKLTRKAERCKNRTKYQLKRMIDCIDYIGEEECRCIKIAHPDELYITDHFIPTHNTRISIGLGIEYLREEKYERIIISRPAVSACGEDQGAYPGSFQEKLAPFMIPLLDEMHHFATESEIKKWTEEKKLILMPLGLLRGHNWNDAYVAIDEAANVTFDQMLLILTRFGRNSKLVMSGSFMQSDLPINKQGAFEDFFEILDGIENIGLCYLGVDDIVRSPFIKQILQRVESFKNRNKNPPKGYTSY